MNLNDLLVKAKIDPRSAVLLRHKPSEPGLAKALPWLALDQPECFNAYQQSQGEKLERVMNSLVKLGHVVSFIGHEPGKALFIGIYSICDATPLTVEDFWNVPEHWELKKLGMIGFQGLKRKSCLWFDLRLQEAYRQWSGKLVVGWPPPERAWWRRAHRNEYPVNSILEESALARKMPEWHELDLSWASLSVLPKEWRSALAQWRGIYYIFDQAEGKGYVGSAYGAENILGRWLNYSRSGDGGNVLLRGKDPSHFQFSILQRVAPDLDSKEVIKLEDGWKTRLHTRKPFGLNIN